MKTAAFKSRNVVFNSEVKPACILVNEDGKIEAVVDYEAHEVEDG